MLFKLCNMCEAYYLTVYSAIKLLPEANWALLVRMKLKLPS